MLSKCIDVPITKEHEEKYGKWNDVPPNLQEIKPKELASTRWGTYGPTHIEFRQFVFPGEKCLDGVHMLFFFDGTGVIIRPLNSCSREFPKGGVKFYSFAICRHDSVELSTEECLQRSIQHFGHCYHVYRCTKCGFLESIDSSD